MNFSIFVQNFEFKFLFILGLDRKLIKTSGIVKDIVLMNNEIFWVTEGSNILNWINKNTNERFHKDMGNFNSY